MPGDDTDEAQHAEPDAEREAGAQLDEQHPPPVAQPHFGQCQRADQQGCRLRAGVAAAGDDERDEHRQDDGLFEFALEVPHRRGREHLAEEQHRQPAAALLQHVAEVHFEVRVVEGFGAAEALHRFGRLVLGHVQHVVGRNDAEEVAVAIDDGQGRAVVLGEGLDHVALRHRRRDRYQRPGGEAVEPRGGVGDDERRQRQFRRQPAVVQHVEQVHRLGGAGGAADVVERLARSPVGLQGDVARRHHAAGRAVRVTEQVARGLQFRRRDRVQDAPGDLGREFVEQPRLVVRGEGADEVVGVAAGQAGEEFFLRRGGQLREDRPGRLTRQDAEQRHCSVPRQVGDDLRGVRGVEPPDRLAQLVPALFGDEFGEVGGEEAADAGHDAFLGRRFRRDSFAFGRRVG